MYRHKNTGRVDEVCGVMFLTVVLDRVQFESHHRIIPRGGVFKIVPTHFLMGIGVALILLGNQKREKINNSV